MATVPCAVGLESHDTQFHQSQEQFPGALIVFTAAVVLTSRYNALYVCVRSYGSTRESLREECVGLCVCIRA